MIRHFLFLPTLIENYAAFLPERAPIYLGAVNALITHIETMKTNGRVLPLSALQMLFDTYHACMSALSQLPAFPFTPTFHMWAHIVFDCIYKGDAWLAATWRDEGLNNMLKRAARGVHAMTFERRVYNRMEVLLQRGARKSRS